MGWEKIHAPLSQEAVFCTHGMSKTPALPSLGLGCGLPSHLPGHSLQERGLTGEFSSRWGGEEEEEEVGKGSYTATAVRPVY